MRSLVLCAVLGGCGFQATRALDPDAAPQELDGGATVDGAIDGAIDGADCFARWRDGSVALSTPQRLTSVNGGGDDRDPWISRDRLTLYFASNRNVVNEIFRAGRTSAEMPFGPPDRLINLTVAGKQQDRASLTDDQRTLVLSSNRGGKFQIFVTGRPDTTTEFGSPNQDHLALVNAGNVDNFDPFIAADARRLYLTTDPGGPAHPRLVVATRLDAGGDFSAPSDVPGVNVNGVDTADPALSPDERVIVFSSNRDGGRGKLDLWYAVRPDIQREFSPPVPIPTVNTDEDDADPMLSADGCELYFAARQDGDFDLYVSQVAH
jgi:Tol biopolymer transport system component